MLTTSTLCLALAIYWEARNQPIKGQLAVADVILNRVADKRYPDNECEVVFQHKQFSFYWDNKSDKPLEENAWHKAKELAKVAVIVPGTAKGSTHYHTTEVQPTWSLCLAPVTEIGDHVFFKL